jgi:hypothetical protein
MSVIGIAAAAAQSNTLRKVDFLGQTHKKPGAPKANAIAALPVGAGSSLLGNAVQSLEQTAAKAQPSASLGSRVNFSA